MADKGEVDIIAIVHNTSYYTAIGAVSVVNHYYGRDNVLLGAFKGEFGEDLGGLYIDDLVDNWDSPVKNYDQVQDPVPVLRQALAQAEDQSVVISSIGFLTNLAQLLKSPSDDISPLSGYQLVSMKVKLVAVMGGIYPSSEDESEYNFDCGKGYMGPALECSGMSHSAITSMPPNVKMVFS